MIEGIVELAVVVAGLVPVLDTASNGFGVPVEGVAAGVTVFEFAGDTKLLGVSAVVSLAGNVEIGVAAAASPLVAMVLVDVVGSRS